ncbi:MAG: sulfatase [Pedobacter sp.]|nr:sulfatase [Pedobacter sp.]MDQ8054341.1 sulfatase [Pedobacter sp.]
MKIDLRFYLSAVLLLALLSALREAPGHADRPKAAPKAPNVVYVLVDEWRAQATGYAGDPNAKTPNLDAMARESVNFSNAVSVLPVCTPHRAALLTGRYPQHTGMFLNDAALPESELTMAEIYRKAGYQTAYIGKWHLDGHGRQSYIPKQRRQGFDYWKVLECTHNYNKSKYFANEDTVAKIWPGYDAYAQTADASAYIQQKAAKKQPFILVLAIGAPHFPHDTAPENMKRKFNAATLQLRKNVPPEMEAEARKEAVGYYAHCAAIDSCIGLLKQAIQKAGITQNTIFVFTSDHGEMLGSHNIHPEAKQRPWDESIKVPFLLHYPAFGANSKKKISVPINTPDILPTLLAICGIQKPATIEGEDLSGLVTGKLKLSDRAALIMNISPFSENFMGKEFRGVRTSRYTYVKSLDGPWLLFDNDEDPYQLNNLVNLPKYKALQDNLEAKLQQQLVALKDTFEPKDYYLKKWGFKVRPKNGEIPYGPGPYPGQYPKSGG